MSYHMGRSWTDHQIEDECPCPQEPCGLVDTEKTNPDCLHHPTFRAKTMRLIHSAEACPAG